MSSFDLIAKAVIANVSIIDSSFTMPSPIEIQFVIDNTICKAITEAEQHFHDHVYIFCSFSI